MKKIINIVDDFVTQEEADNLISISKTLPLIPCNNTRGHFAMRCHIKSNEPQFKWINERIKKQFPIIKDQKLYFAWYNFDIRHNKNNLQPHYDEADYNFILYLDGNHGVYNGTGFWCDQNSETKDLVLNTYVGFQRNRGLLFNGREIFHGGLQGLGESSSRLTLSIFLFKDWKKDNNGPERDTPEVWNQF